MYVCVLAPACRRLIDQAYSPFHAVLHCGNLSSDVQVFPRPEPVVVDDEVDPMPRVVNTGSQAIGSRCIYCRFTSTLQASQQIYPICLIADLEIVGFIEIGDISSPPVTSRHLVLPIAVIKGLHFMFLTPGEGSSVRGFNSQPEQLG